MDLYETTEKTQDTDAAENNVATVAGGDTGDYDDESATNRANKLDQVLLPVS